MEDDFEEDFDDVDSVETVFDFVDDPLSDFVDDPLSDFVDDPLSDLFTTIDDDAVPVSVDLVSAVSDDTALFCLLLSLLFVAADSDFAVLLLSSLFVADAVSDLVLVVRLSLSFVTVVLARSLDLL